MDGLGLGLPAACLAAEPYATVLADQGSGSPATLRAAIRDLMGEFGLKAWCFDPDIELER